MTTMNDDLQRQNREFESLLSATADFNYIFDRQGRFSYINRALLSLLGLTQEQAIGKNFIDLKYPEPLASKLQAQIEQVFVTGQPVKDETVYVNYEGKWGYYEYIFMPMLDQAGHVEGVAGSTRDISIHKRAQADLKASEERFKQLAEISTFGLVIGNMDGSLNYANATILKLLGYDSGDFENGRMRWDQLTPPEYAEKHAQAWRELSATGFSAPYEKEFIAKDGRRIPILVGAATLTKSDGPPEIAAYILDLSAVRAAQSALRESEGRLAELNRNLEKLVVERTHELENSKRRLEISLKEKEVLLREVHHRVKNNLQVISSLLRLQSHAVSDSEAAAVLAESQNRIRSMSLVHELLYQSRNVSGINFKNYLEMLLIQLFRVYNAEDRHILYAIDAEDLEISLDKAMPCGLIATELVVNALKHAFAGQESGRLIVTFRREGPDAVLAVEDNGTGMSADIASENKSSLGFTIIHALSKQLRGKGNFSAAVGGGTRFELRFGLEENKI